MPSKLNSEFNYRYQVMGHTIWEKIKILQGFLEGRICALGGEEVSKLKIQAKYAELDYLKETNAPKHKILMFEAEIMEIELHTKVQKQAFELNRQEIVMLERLLKEAYEIAEPTRIPGYTDEQMFEANAANEFTAVIAREIQAEIIATGHPSPAKLGNAMSNPMTFNALKEVGLIPKEVVLLAPSNDPLNIKVMPLEEPTEVKLKAVK
jgi:hypothetical protein